MSIVKVKDERVIERQINGKNGPQILREQRACILLGGGYETTFNLSLGTGPVYQVGDYLFHPDSYGQGQYGDVALKRVKLWPLGHALRECGIAPPSAPKA